MPVYNDVCLQNMVSATQHFISKLVNLIFYTTSKLVNGFIEAAKRHALIKQTKDIYCPCCDCRNRHYTTTPRLAMDGLTLKAATTTKTDAKKL